MESWNRGEAAAPCGVRPGAQRIVPVVVGGIEQARDLGFPSGRLVSRANHASHLAGARGDAQSLERGGARLRGQDGFLQESGGLHSGRFTKLLHQDEREGQDGGCRERPAHGDRFGAARGRARSGKTGIERPVRVNALEIQALPRFRRGRQAGGEHALAIAHTLADRALQFLGLGAALPASFQMGPDLAHLASGQFAIQVAQQQTFVGVAQIEITHRAPS